MVIQFSSGAREKAHGFTKEGKRERDTPTVGIGPVYPQILARRSKNICGGDWDGFSPCSYIPIFVSSRSVDGE